MDDNIPNAIDFPKLSTLYEPDKLMKLPRLKLQVCLNSFGQPVMASDFVPKNHGPVRKALNRIADRLKKGSIRKVLVVRWI